MRNILILTAVLSVMSLNAIFGQCDATPDDLGLVNVKGGPNGKITLNANTALTYDVGLFGTLLLEVPISTTGASISGAEAVGLQFVQLFNSEDAGLPAGKRYAFFASSVTINPMTLFPVGVDVEIGTITTVPESNITSSTIVLTDILPPVNNGGTYAYYKTAVQVCNTNNFNDNLIADAPDQTLPIAFSEFTAEKYDDVSSKLNWSTSSEINGSHFEIERSTDAQAWSKIGTVKAKGESLTLTNYEYVDENVILLRGFASNYYYRINMFDLDGNSEYSEIRTVHFTDLKREINIYPNPATDRITIDMFSELSGQKDEATAILRDMNGKLVRIERIRAMGGSDIDLSGLQSGIFLLEINSNNFKTYHKIQIVD